jgi:hypothetical protein
MELTFDMNRMYADALSPYYGVNNAEFFIELLNEESITNSTRRRFFILAKDSRKTIKLWREHRMDLYRCHYLFLSDIGGDTFGFDTEEDYNYYRLVDDNNIRAAVDIEDMVKYLKKKFPHDTWLDKLIK